MIRIICREEDNRDVAAGVGEPCATHKTFDLIDDVTIRILEGWLAEPGKINNHYVKRWIVGVEVKL